MPRLNLGELIPDPDFCQDFTVTRRSGIWENARFIPQEETLQAYGIIIPQDTSEMDITNPDGTLIQGRIRVYTHTKLYVTVLNNPETSNNYISDEVNWQGNKYSVILDNNYSDYGYYSYICQLKDATGGSNS